MENFHTICKTTDFDIVHKVTQNDHTQIKWKEYMKQIIQQLEKRQVQSKFSYATHHKEKITE